MRIGTLCFNVGDLAGAQEALERAVTLASELGSFRDQTRSITLSAPSSTTAVRSTRRNNWPCRRSIGSSEPRTLSPAPEPSRACPVRARARRPRARRGAAPDRGPDRLEVGGWIVIEIYRFLVETLVRQGRIDEARELVEFAAGTCRPKTPMPRPPFASPRPRSQQRTASRIARSRASTRRFGCSASSVCSRIWAKRELRSLARFGRSERTRNRATSSNVRAKRSPAWTPTSWCSRSIASSPKR